MLSRVLFFLRCLLEFTVGLLWRVRKKAKLEVTGEARRWRVGNKATEPSLRGTFQH